MAVIFLLKGYDKFTHHHHVLGGLIFLFGLVALFYFLYMVFERKESRALHILIHLFEAFASLFTAYIFHAEGKKYLQYGLLLAAVGFFVSTYLYVQRNRGAAGKKR